MSNDTPRTPAAFINAIAEEGTKAEAVEYLQKIWNERCQFERELAAANRMLDRKVVSEDGLALYAEIERLKAELAAYRQAEEGLPEEPSRWTDYSDDENTIVVVPAADYDDLRACAVKVTVERETEKADTRKLIQYFEDKIAAAQGERK